MFLMMALVTNISWPQTMVAKYRKGMTFLFAIVLAFFGVLIELCDFYGYYKIEKTRRMPSPRSTKVSG